MPSYKLLWLLPVLLLAACEAGEDRYSGDASTASAIAADTALASETPGAFSSTERKVIRTADIHCKVPDVLTAVTDLERAVRAVGGTVEESNIENSTGATREVYHSPDSLKRVQIYTTTAFMTLRVPAAMLDSVVGIIPSSASFVESRKLGQQDVTFRYLSNELKNKPDEKTGSDGKTAQKMAKDTRDAIEAQRYEDARKEKVIDRHVENLRLMDNVNYATLTVSYSQPERVFAQVVVNPDKAMSVPYTTQMKVAMSSGMDAIGNIFLAFLGVWPVWCFLAVGVTIALLLLKQKRKLPYVPRQ